MDALPDLVTKNFKAAKGLDATFQVGGSVDLQKPVRIVWEDPPRAFLGTNLPGEDFVGLAGLQGHSCQISSLGLP